MEKRAIGLNKKSTIILTLFSLMFFVSCLGVSAALNVDAINRNTFNYGDKFVVSGNVKLDQDARSFLYLTLVCGENSNNLATTFLDLKKDRATSFSQFVTIPNAGLSGDCYVQAKVVSGSEILENANSNIFALTNDLSGSFDVSVGDSVQLGDVFSLSGAFVSADKTGVDGTAVIRFKQGEETILFDSASISGGQLSYKKDLSLIPAGSYVIDIRVQDNLGNSHDFANVAVFEVSDKLVISADVDKTIYSPGEVAVLTGKITPYSNVVVENLEVEADFDGTKLKDVLPDAKFPFSIKYNVPSNMRSGDYDVRVIAKDDKGNYGSTIAKLSIKSVPTTLSLVLEKGSYVPENNLVFKVNLLDQANDFIDESVVVKLYNEKGEFEKSKLASTNTFDYLIIPYMGLPGSWKLSAEGFGLTAEKMFNILSYKKLEVDITNGVLYAKNIGNTIYDDYVDVQAGNLLKGRKVVLDLNESTFINLNELFDAGVYDLIVPATGENFTLVSVPEKPGFFSGLAGITGNTVLNLKSSSNGLWFIGLLLVVILGLVLIFKPAKKGRYSEDQRAKDVRDGQKMLEQLRSKGIRKGPIKSNYEYPEIGTATEEERKDFAQRMAKQVASEQERIAKESFSSRWKGETKDLHNYSTSGAFENFGTVHKSQNSQRINLNQTDKYSNLPFEKKEEKIKDGEGFSSGGMINW